MCRVCVGFFVAKLAAKIHINDIFCVFLFPNFIVMKINGKPVGLRKIDTVIPDGMLFVVADGPKQEELQKIADEINESIVVANRIKADL